MIHRPKVLAAVLAALVLTAALPAAGVGAASPAGSSTRDEVTTPLNKNLLHNAGFESVRTDGTLKSWTVAGSAHPKTFSTTSWPTKAYAAKYQGGKRYLTCGKGSGSVTQTVPYDLHPVKGEYRLRARLQTNFGGVKGHQIRVTLQAIGTPGATGEKLRVLDITHSYKEAFTAITVPDGTTQLVVTLELLPKAGSTNCHVVADSVSLDVIKF